MALAGCAALFASHEAGALKLDHVTASWPEALVRFQSGFVPATISTPGASALGTPILWFGPGQTSDDGAALVYRPPNLPVELTARAGRETVSIGSVQVRNFPTTTKGPVELVLEFELAFREPTLASTLQISFEINHTSDDVLNLGACPSGSATTSCVFSARRSSKFPLVEVSTSKSSASTRLPPIRRQTTSSRASSRPRIRLAPRATFSSSFPSQRPRCSFLSR